MESMVIMMIFFAVALPVMIGAWIFATNNFIYSLLNARICCIVLSVMAAGGVIGCIVTGVNFNISIADFEKAGDACQVVKDNFHLFTTIDCAFIGFGVVLCLVSALLKNKMSMFVPVVMPLWAALSLIWTALLSRLSAVEWFDISLHITVFGICAAMATAIPLLPGAFARVSFLSDKEKVAGAFKEKREKKRIRQEKRAKKKNLSQKKKNLKNPKRT